MWFLLHAATCHVCQRGRADTVCRLQAGALPAARRAQVCSRARHTLQVQPV